MIKCLDFKTYKDLKKVSFNDMNRFTVELYKNGFEDGCEATIKTLETDLLKIKGIGKKTVSKISGFLNKEYKENKENKGE